MSAAPTVIIEVKVAVPPNGEVTPSGRIEVFKASSTRDVDEALERLRKVMKVQLFGFNHD